MPSTRPDLTGPVTAELRRLLDGPPEPARLGAALRLLAKWRAEILTRHVERRDGPQVQGGPFAGMDYATPSSEGARLPRLLGCYEASLAPVFEEIVARAYPLVIDIGCAEGYVAVGLARRMPASRVLARDTDARARALCARMAERNGVAAQVEVGGAVTAADFALCAHQPTVVICDIEGAEEALLDPLAAPGLRQADVLVEAHDILHPGLSGRIAARFADSHRIRRIDRQIDAGALPGWFEGLGDLDRLLALWEWRSGPTPWLWMQRL